MPPPLPTPAVPWPAVPGYEILEELGRGGMGVVYKARQVAARRLVALKMIRDGVLAGPEHRARFRIEAEAAARCQHPHLVRIYEVGEHAGLPFFSMEWAAGGSLDKKLAGRTLPPQEAAQLVRTLAEAVQYAHDKKILHRDLKPANVVLTDDGRPLITDFGLAKRLDSDTAVTPSQVVMGTASYMAPEQAEGGTRPVGPAADVYALGAILYELLTGRPPFRGATWQDTVQQVLANDPAPPTRLRPEVPADLETICLKCLEKEPEQRYAGAAELAEDLGRFRAGTSITAAPGNEFERQARWAARAGFALEEILTYGVRDIVYKARQVHLNRSVALKVIAAPAQADPEARLRQEAETVARLDHPNIVRIYSSGELQGRTYLAFEYVAGGSLVERFAGPVPPRQAAELVRQLARAMDYAHQRGVLHCALKPSNVLLSADGVPKITSFGLSSLREQPEAEQRPALRRLPSYMAPELMDGRGDEVGPATDVYALGAILYKLLTGGPPFLGETVDETVEQVRSQMPPPPSEVQPGVPDVLDEVCRKCLAKRPEGRYASAALLAEELACFLAGGRPADSASAEEQPRVPGYEILRELARGSMSRVYEARQLAGDRLVAFKVMDPAFSFEKPVHDLLREVAEGVSRLQHPNILPTHECGEVGGRPFFVMELVPGGSLVDRRDDGPMPVAAAAALVRALAGAMEAAHRQGIIHGNLKPSKVLLAADGTPRITGFLIGPRQRRQDEDRNLTAGGSRVLGTPRYMAPEQLGGNPAAMGPATDVYGLGLILYELLTGWLPHRAVRLPDMIWEVLTQPPEPPRQLRPDVLPDLETICLTCLHKEPERRYPSAGTLAEELDRFLAGKPLAWRAMPRGLPDKGLAESGPAAAEGPLPPPGVWARLGGWLRGRPRS
jgi:serine/threonine protein kinase